MRDTKPLFRPVGTSDYNEVCSIENREKVYDSLGLYSDHLNWNINPGLEAALRKLLCEIYGHVQYSKYSWKYGAGCYWCVAPNITTSNPQGLDIAKPVMRQVVLKARLVLRQRKTRFVYADTYNITVHIQAMGLA